ncbi:Tetrathionate reductase sensory transduction histidine kinase [Vibrio chagasii]|nr:Tetrathionate reductase sensory transduction histidine kinase [Vibrio chagasii]CAH6804414.1 Tetrathionate reductase sensory transduction histidine kinase [Vibrio chagasii]CAH6812458.1 Tetrathionate reductase sensory transduction histidine kinase [Vibrio chagasii]CAH6817803.1 Tetrathionate reductase sensory transduction histidine kinase [Vibrio chagasii]CAH6834814.1 Tetrathionate reductase sensory transduction histidine kinase [Vibrio chagasii]
MTVRNFITFISTCWMSLSAGICFAAQTEPVSVATSTIESDQTIEVGVLAIRGKLAAQQRWQPTMDWLSERIPGKHFVLKPFNLEEMAEAVKKVEVDFVITNPGQAVRLGRQYDLSWMATMTSHNYNDQGVSSTRSIGSALVVRRMSPYISFEQLVGKPIAAVSENAFGGYLTMRYQVMQEGLNPNQFFSNTHFLGFPIDASLYQLREGHIEAAVVPACLVENMISEGLLVADQYRVIGNKAPEGFRCQVSTPLYSNWSFAKTERASSALAKQMSQVLFAMPKSSVPAIAANASGWTSPTSLLPIDKLYQQLDMHPLQQPWWKEALIWLKYNQQWAWAFFLLVVFLNVYHFWLEFKFSRSKKQLEATLNKLKSKSEQLEHSQRIAVVGELGSSLAHEINQPLAAIRNYSEGGLLRISKNKPLTDIEPVFEKIQSQVDRADAIIQRLRNMIKKRSSEKSQRDIEQLLTDTIELLQFRLEQHQITIERYVVGQPIELYIDSVGLQQVIVNLINNATDACNAQQQRAMSDIDYKNHEPATIKVITEYQPDKMMMSVVDNGTGLDFTEHQVTQAFVSSKENGLGLGLAICQDVIEDHCGQMSITSLTPHGCHVAVTLPFSLSNDS